MRCCAIRSAMREPHVLQIYGVHHDMTTCCCCWRRGTLCAAAASRTRAAPPPPPPALHAPVPIAPPMARSSAPVAGLLSSSGAGGQGMLLRGGRNTGPPPVAAAPAVAGRWSPPRAAVILVGPVLGAEATADSGVLGPVLAPPLVIVRVTTENIAQVTPLILSAGGAISREDDALLPCPADRNGRHWTRVELSVVLLKYRCKLAWQMWSRRGQVGLQAAA